MHTAQEIYSSVLDALTGYLEAGDAVGVQRYIALPFRMDMLDRSHICHTEADLRTIVENYKARMVEAGVTSLCRSMDDARFVNEQLVEGFHVTAPLRYETPVIEPYAIRSMIIWDKDAWRSNHQEIIANSDDLSILPPRTRTALHRARRPFLDARRPDRPEAFQ